jgi:hypothetical protein
VAELVSGNVSLAAASCGICALLILQRHLTLLSPDADEPGCCAHGDEGAISQILPRAKCEPELRHVPLAASRWKDLNLKHLKGSERIGLLNQLQSIQIGPV